MSWTPEQLLKHPKADSLLGGVNIKSKDAASKKATNFNNTLLSPPVTGSLSFTVAGDPTGKPRMTQRDRWAKRPAVLRYRAYCDRIREAAPNKLKEADVYAIDIIAHIAMAPSWSQKKKLALNGTIHRLKPDYDNIAKAVGDALMKEDSGIGDGRCRKFWCEEGQQRTEVKVWFYEKSVLS